MTPARSPITDTPYHISPNIMFSPISGDGKRRQQEEMEHKGFDLNLPSSAEGPGDFMTPAQFPITGTLYHDGGMTFSPSASGYSSSSTEYNLTSFGYSSTSTRDDSSSSGYNSSSTGDITTLPGYNPTSSRPTSQTCSPSPSYISTSSDYRRTALGYSLTSRRIRCKRSLFTDCIGNSPQSD